MNQLVSRKQGQRLAIGPTPAEVITIPYNSNSKENPVCVNLYGYGFTTVSGSVKRFMFVLPVIYYSKGADYFSIPASGEPQGTASTKFTHLEYADAGDTSTFAVEVYPQASGGGLSVYVSTPDTGTDWDVFCYADIYSEL